MAMQVILHNPLGANARPEL
jgi:hypothetical protein